MNTNTEREELIELLDNERWKPMAADPTDDFSCGIIEQSNPSVADALLAAGYHKPRVLGYVVVGRDGLMHRVQYETRRAAQEVADEWAKDAKNSGVDWDYRVAEIVEATK